MAAGEGNEGVFGKVRKSLLGVAKWVSRGARLLAFGGTWLSALMMASYPDGGTPTWLALLGLFGLAILYASPLVAGLGMLLRIGGRRLEGTLRHDEGGLTLVAADGTRRALGDRVESGIIVPAGGHYDVQLRLVGGNTLSVHVADEESAERLLDLCGVDEAKRRTHVRWASPLRRLVSSTAGGVLAFVLGSILVLSLPRALGVAGLFAVPIVPFFIGGAFSRFFAWRELEVGADGIGWRFHGRRKVVPLSDVGSVEVLGDQLVVRLADGTDRRFELEGAGLAEGLRRRIDAALDSMGRGQAKQTFFARGELSFAEWTARMRALLKQTGAFRDAPIGVEDALRVLEDAKAAPEVRVGAALALQERGEPETTARIRVVADNCVSPKLRVALEEAVAGEVEEEVVLAAADELRTARRAGS